MTRPRQISAEMVESMRRAAGKVWRKYVDEVPEADRAEWEKLCKAHVANWFAREWGAS